MVRKLQVWSTSSPGAVDSVCGATFDVIFFRDLEIRAGNELVGGSEGLVALGLGLGREVYRFLSPRAFMVIAHVNLDAWPQLVGRTSGRLVHLPIARTSLASETLRSANPDRRALYAALVQQLRSLLDHAPDAALDRAYHVLLTEPRSNIVGLARSLGMSERSLRDKFETRFHVTPKTVHRFARHNRWLTAGCRNPKDWLDAALRSGFYDQAHATREMKTILDTTPAKFFGARGSWDQSFESSPVELDNGSC